MLLVLVTREFLTYNRAIPSTITNSSPPPLRDPPCSSPSPMPLLCASYSSKVAELHNIQGVQTSSSGPLLLLLLLWVSSLDTLLSMLRLFTGISSYILLSSTYHSFTHPPGVVSLLFILGLTPHCAPLDNYLLLLCSTLLLNSTLPAYLSALSLSLLFSFGSFIFLTSSQQLIYPVEIM
jgi:hypothetical protein